MSENTEKKPFFFKKSLVMAILTFLIPIVCLALREGKEASLNAGLIVAGSMLLLACVTTVVFLREKRRADRWAWENWKESITSVKLKGIGKHLSKETNAFHPETDPEPFEFEVTYKVGEYAYEGAVKLDGKDLYTDVLLSYIPLKKVNRELSKRVVKTRILDMRSTFTTQNNGVGRAVAGYIVAGAVGSVIGAATARERISEHKETMFKLWYADGHTGIRTVQNGSEKWHEYMELLEGESNEK